MWRYQNTDELYHHGILGMRWGVRRYQNKDRSYTSADKNKYQKVSRKVYNKELDSLTDKYIKKDPRTKQINKLAKDAIAYGKKHKLDLDDGGGGSRKAGQKYNKMWEQHFKKSMSIKSDAHTKAYKELISKYGEKRAKQIKRQNTAIGLAAVSGLILTSAAVFELASKGAKYTAKIIGKGIKYTAKAAGKGVKKVYNYAKER